MTTNEILKSVYHNAIRGNVGYDLTAAPYSRDVGVGTSKPMHYSSCPDFYTDCQSYNENNCKSYIVKKGTGINHEFIDTTLAALFLNNGPMSAFLTRYPQDGYYVLYVDEDGRTNKLNILGTASPLMCGFQSITDIIKRYRALGDKNLDIHDPEFNLSGYLHSLREYLNKTDAQSITDYYVSQYVSGGGDPNIGNIGFAEIHSTSKNQYEYVFAKVDLGASFKDCSTISGSKPSLENNKYAFNIPNHIKTTTQLYDYAIQHGNILMPGQAYDCEQEPKFCRWSGHGNAGFYNGAYNRWGTIYGIDMKDYVKMPHLQNSLTKLCSSNKSDIINTFKSSALKIYELLSHSEEKDVIPMINENEANFNRYIDGRADFIGTRYDHICSLTNDNDGQTNHKSFDQTWYDDHGYNIVIPVGMAVVVAAASYYYLCK